MPANQVDENEKTRERERERERDGQETRGQVKHLSFTRLSGDIFCPVSDGR